MYNFSKRRVAFWAFIIIVGEIVFLHFFFDKNFLRGSKKVKAYRLLSAKDLQDKGPDLFEQIFPQFSENTTNFNDIEAEANFTSDIRPVFEENDMFVLFMVNSVPENFEQRQLIRTTWANTWRSSKKNGKGAKSLYKGRDYPKLYSNCIFLLGLSVITKHDRRVSQEAGILGDIFRVGIEDVYANTVDKLWKAYEWALNVKTKYIFKVEDGVYVNIPRMIHWLNTDKDLPGQLYAGYVVHRHPIEDQSERELEETNEKSTEDDEKIVLPNYCLGAFYIFSTNILESLVDSSKTAPRIQAGEDAYMGLLTKENYVLPYNVGNSLFVLDGSHGALAIEYTEEKLKHSVCIGDQLKNEYITQLHERYVYIRKRIDGRVS